MLFKFNKQFLIYEYKIKLYISIVTLFNKYEIIEITRFDKKRIN